MWLPGRTGPHRDLVTAWLEALRARVGARRWILVTLDESGMAIEIESVDPVDELYPALWAELAGRQGALFRLDTCRDLGDLGRRFAAVGVDHVLVAIARGEGVALILENDDPERSAELTENDLIPTPEMIAARWGDLLAMRRWSSDLLALRRFVDQSLDVIDESTSTPTRLFDPVEPLRESMGALAALALRAGPNGLVECRGCWVAGNETRYALGGLSGWSWADASANPAGALRAAADDLGIPSSREWRVGGGAGLPLILGFQPGSSVPSTEAMSLYVSNVITFESWHKAVMTAERNTLLAERARLAMAIHEGSIQHLTNVAVQLEIAGHDTPDDELTVELGEARTAVLDAIDSLRGLLLDLTEPEIQTARPFIAGMVRAVDDYGDEWALDVDMLVEGDERSLPDAAVRFLHNVVHEGLVNARRHSKTSAATVTIRFREGDVVVEVSDRGVGFDVDALDRRSDNAIHGLGLLQRQAPHAGAAIEVESTPGEGTVLRCVAES